MIEEHCQKLLYLEVESHIKGQVQRENRLIQLRFLSFTIVTGVVSFSPIDVLLVPFILLALVFALVGLFVFDLFYCKVNKQESLRISVLTEASKVTSAAQLEVFPKKDLTKVEWQTALAFDHLWYLFILILAFFIVSIKAAAAVLGD